MSPRNDTHTSAHISLAKVNYKITPNFKRQGSTILLCALKQNLNI